MRQLLLPIAILTHFALWSQWTDNGTNITTSDNVGIGTTNPQHGKLQIYGTGASEGINFWTNSGETTSRLWIDNQAKTFHISKGSNPDLGITLNNNGLIGIGTTTPTRKLHINAGNDDGIAISSGNAILGDNGSGVFTQLVFWNGSNAYYGRSATGAGVSNHFFRTGGSDRMIINSAGNIGIGTINPTERLSVNGLIKIEKATNTDNNSPGIVLVGNDDFLYDGQYINHYGFGFHGFQDGSSQWNEPVNSYMSGYFGIDFFTSGQNRLRISNEGIVSIGTTQRQVGYKLAVNGKIKAKEIKVETGWADYVFKEDYSLPTLEEVAKHIHEKGHLINIPSAQEVEENGIELGEMNKLLLEKIEELTLYTLQQQQQINDYEKNIHQLLKRVEVLERSTNNLKQ